MLLLVTAVWGWTFVLVKDAITQYPTLPFLEIRFLLALVVLVVLVHRLPTRRELRIGGELASLSVAADLEFHMRAADIDGEDATHLVFAGFLHDLDLIATPRRGR